MEGGGKGVPAIARRDAGYFNSRNPAGDSQADPQHKRADSSGFVHVIPVLSSFPLHPPPPVQGMIVKVFDPDVLGARVLHDAADIAPDHLAHGRWQLGIMLHDKEYFLVRGFLDRGLARVEIRSPDLGGRADYHFHRGNLEKKFINAGITPVRHCPAQAVHPVVGFAIKSQGSLFVKAGLQIHG